MAEKTFKITISSDAKDLNNKEFEYTIAAAHMKIAIHRAMIQFFKEPEMKGKRVRSSSVKVQQVV